MEKVKIYNAKGIPQKKGNGIFAKFFMEHFPRTPVEEDSRLYEPKLRENFIERIFTLKDWRESLAKGRSLTNLVHFHTKHKLLILSHSQKHYKEMGKLVAHGKELSLKALYGKYEDLLMDSLRFKTTVSKNTNVLQHLMGYFKRELSADEKKELLEVIGQYQAGFVPLIVPITLINHYVRKYGQPYLMEQSYLHPHPIALKLRNHV